MWAQYQFNQRLIAAARAQIPSHNPCPGFQYDARYALPMLSKPHSHAGGRGAGVHWCPLGSALLVELVGPSLMGLLGPKTDCEVNDDGFSRAPR